ncbi:MAG: nucleotidyltransferase family protein [Pseudomonadota bacterium]
MNLSSTIGPEMSLIQDILFLPEFRLPEAGDEFWQAFVSACQNECVDAVVYYLLKKRGMETGVPALHRDALARRFQQNLISNLSLRGHLKQVLARLNEADVAHLLLKGFALAEYLYPSLGMRGMSDVDLLVRKGDLAAVDICLNGFGYHAVDTDVAGALKNPEGYLSSLEYHRKNEIPPIMHIHWHPVNTSVPADVFSPFFNVDRLWEKASVVRLDEVETRILSPEHLLIYLCEHALRVNHSFDRLILIYDIYHVLETCRDRIDWDAVVSESRTFHLSDLLYFSLDMVTQYAGPVVPRKVMEGLQPRKMSWEQRLFRLFQKRGLRIRGSSYLLYLSMNEGACRKLRFLMRTLFPPRTIQRQRKRAHEINLSSLFDRPRFLEIARHVFSILFRLLRR